MDRKKGELAKLIMREICRKKGYCLREIVQDIRLNFIVEKRRNIARILSVIGFSYAEIGYSLERDPATIRNLITPRKRQS